MNLLSHARGRKVLFACLYFSEGAPIGFIWWALPTLLREDGLGVDRIASLAAVLVLPWAFKFLWAPAVDVLRGGSWTLREWIVAAQAVMAATLAPLLWLDWTASFGLVTALLAAHAVAAATQDAAIDALAVATTADHERGAINGWMQAGMLAGRALFGGVALFVAARTSRETIVALLLATILAMLALALAFRVDATARGRTELVERAGEVVQRLRQAFASRTTWIALLFAATGAAGFEAVGAVAGPFLIDYGLGSGEVGLFFAGPALVCMLAGGIIGGYISDRLGRRRTVAGASAFIVAAIVAVATIAAVEPAAIENAIASARPDALVLSMAAMYLGIGLFTASSYALFMDLTDPALGATQFSAFMGATNLCEAWAAAAVGRLIVADGYATAFLVMAAVSVLALGPLAALRR